MLSHALLKRINRFNWQPIIAEKAGKQKYLSQTNHLGLDTDLAPNSTCLTKISQKQKEKPFFFFHSLNGKHMTSVFADGDFVFLERRRQFKTIWLRHYFSPKTPAFRENQMHYFRCLIISWLFGLWGEKITSLTLFYIFAFADIKYRNPTYLVSFAFLSFRLLFQFINRNKHLLFCCKIITSVISVEL